MTWHGAFCRPRLVFEAFHRPTTTATTSVLNSRGRDLERGATDPGPTTAGQLDPALPIAAYESLFGEDPKEIYLMDMRRARIPTYSMSHIQKRQRV